MTDGQLVLKTKKYIKSKFENDSTGHDWWHMTRVWKLAKSIAATETGANLLVVELGALLHDIGDWKFHEDDDAGPIAARQWLESFGVDNKIIIHSQSLCLWRSKPTAHVYSRPESCVACKL
jgi:uncharacterized protein